MSGEQVARCLAAEDTDETTLADAGAYAGA
jgi:hypothetical protein